MIALSPSSGSKGKKLSINQVEKRKCLILGSVFNLIKLKVESVCSPETSINLNPAIGRHISQDNIHQNCLKYLKEGKVVVPVLN
jgi:hypothetical protein